MEMHCISDCFAWLFEANSPALDFYSPKFGVCGVTQIMYLLTATLELSIPGKKQEQEQNKTQNNPKNLIECF